MIHEKYNISGLGEVSHYLDQVRDKEEDWRIDFYNTYDELLFTFESDEETLKALKDEDDMYRMITEYMDIAIMMGREV